MRSRHILILSHNYWPEPTGIPYYNTGMAEWLVGNGDRVTVLTGKPHYPWWSVPQAYRRRGAWRGAVDERRRGVDILRAPHYAPEGPPSGLQRLLLDATWLLGACWRSFSVRRRPDCVVLVAPPFLIGLLGLLLRWRWRRPVVYHVQDLQIEAARDLGMLPPRLCRILLAIERQLLRRLDLVTTCSRGMLRRLQAKARSRRPAVLFANWADPVAQRSEPESGCYREIWQVPPDRVVCMYSGNLGRKQGLDDLLDCFIHHGVAADLVVAGRGAVRDQIEERLAASGLQHIRLLDLQPVERLAAFLAAGDIHCIPQKRAVADLVMPSKLLNIMAVARPVVVAAEPDTELARTVREADCGLVVPPEDAAAFAAALGALCADPARRLRLGQNGQRYLSTRLRTDIVLGGFRGRIEDLITSTSSRAP